jgi:hypothetical protein
MDRVTLKNKSKKNRDQDVVRPGQGTDEIYLGQRETEVREILGKPDHTIRRFRDSYFYIYKRKGMDLDFGKKSGKLKVIFFYRKGCEGHGAAKVITDKGVLPGDTRAKVVRTYGSPDDQHTASVFRDGFYLREWFFYRVGIQFQFGPDRRVDIISISRKKKTESS